MKILLVNHLLDTASGGGTAERTLQLARGMSQLGVDVTVLTLDVGLSPSLHAQLGSVRLEAVPCLKKRYFIPALSFRRARHLVANVDVVLLSGHWTVLNLLIGLACRRVGRPYLFAPAGALMPFGRSLKLKRIYDLLVGKALVREAVACIAVTEAELSDFATYDVKKTNICVIPNGVDLDAYHFDDPIKDAVALRELVGVGNSPFLLFLGRLNTIKGPDILVDAFSILSATRKDLHLIMAGPDGGMLAQLQSKVATQGLEQRVHFPGFLRGAMKVAALREAELLVIPSRREAMSIVVLEGGVCGCPVLFTDACGLDNFAQRGAGAMVEVSVDALANALKKLLQDYEKCRNMAFQLQQIVHEEYTWSEQAGRHIEFVQHVLAKRR